MQLHHRLHFLDSTLPFKQLRLVLTIESDLTELSEVMGKFLFFVAFAFCAWIGIKFLDAHEKDQNMRPAIEAAKGTSLELSEWDAYIQGRKSVTGVSIKVQMKCFEKETSNFYICNQTGSKLVWIAVKKIDGPSRRNCFMDLGCVAGMVPYKSEIDTHGGLKTLNVQAEAAFAP